MANYLLICSRDCFESGDAAYLYDQAKELGGRGNRVTLFLVQNATLMARKGVEGNPLQKVVGAKNVEVLADEFSLKERAITRDSLLGGVKTSNVDQLVDLLTQDGVKAVWH